MRTTEDEDEGGGRGRTQAAGFALVAVLVVIMLASMVVVSLLFRVRAEDTATAASAGNEQAWAAVMTGVQEVIRFVQQSPPGSLDWQNSPEAFRDRLVYEDGADQWYFTVFTAGDPEELEEVRFGLTDEASKLDLNMATEEALGKLPKLTTLLVEALMDFRDPDDEARPEGAEQEYYDTLPTPYTIRNGPLASVDELLLVRGFTPSLVYGEDANGNFRLDPNEDDGDESFPPDDNNNRLELGLRQWLALNTYDLNEDHTGFPRTDLNNPDDPLIESDLPEATVVYIEALRRNGVTLSHPAELFEARGSFKDAEGKDVELESGVDQETLPVVLDRLTTSTELQFKGLINVNTASAVVLQLVPGIDLTLAEAILSTRRYLTPERRQSLAWLVQEGVVDAAKFKALAPWLTVRSYQYRFHVLGYGVPSGRFRVFEVVLDFGQVTPAITYLREWTRQGVPFKIELNQELFRG